jgi:ribonucleotide monophosphatase NagD (HAD superfamily)
MIGDQLETDIRGARDFGLHSALVTTGIARVDQLLAGSSVRPDYLLDTLEVSGA